jgi:hypothetical protein
VGVGLLRNDVRGVSLERLLRNCPVCHSKQQSVLVEHGEGGESCEEQSERIKRNKSLSRYVELGKDSPKRCDVGRKAGDGREFLLQRQTQGVYLCTRHCPVENSHRIDDVSRGQM